MCSLIPPDFLTREDVEEYRKITKEETGYDMPYEEAAIRLPELINLVRTILDYKVDKPLGLLLPRPAYVYKPPVPRKRKRSPQKTKESAQPQLPDKPESDIDQLRREMDERLEAIERKLEQLGASTSRPAA